VVVTNMTVDLKRSHVEQTIAESILEM
jgi:hypothetical protein